MKAADVLGWTRTLSPIGWAAAAVEFVVVAGLVSCAVTAPGRHKAEARQAEVATTLASARTDSAQQAVEVVARAADRDARAEHLTQENHDEILNAPGADQQLDARLNRIGRSGLCKRAAYHSRPECLQLAGAVEPPDARPAR